MNNVCRDAINAHFTGVAYVPDWVAQSLGKMVTITHPYDGYEAGHHGLLVSIRTKGLWGRRGVYATVALNLGDTGDEENVELEHLAPYEK